MSAESDALALALLDGAEAFALIVDGADGFRADLIRRGWSAGPAEQIAAEWLAGAIRCAWAARP